MNAVRLAQMNKWIEAIERRFDRRLKEEQRLKEHMAHLIKRIEDRNSWTSMQPYPKGRWTS